MKTNNTFSHDLEVGQGRENLLSQILQDSKLEVKFDRFPNTRHFIEVKKFVNGKQEKSGLSATESEWYAICKTNYNILVETEILKRVLTDIWSKNSRRIIKDSRGINIIPDVFISGGDGNRSYGFLLEEEQLFKLLAKYRSNENK